MTRRIYGRKTPAWFTFNFTLKILVLFEIENLKYRSENSSQSISNSKSNFKIRNRNRNEKLNSKSNLRNELRIRTEATFKIKLPNSRSQSRVSIISNE
ncbi:unnamed protein product [Rotaria magnacalcarata]|uniref:Uncharacterized protein n=1 Tax=Rotaria magnacalcarata TaxID=392030 RepID=A0A820E931_9BILA|nr:unnamed protein product [Rotaria magnacalcarata]